MGTGHVTEAEWNAKGKELFGDDQTAWAFVCPRCGHVMSVAKARVEYAADLPRLRAAKLAVEAECIGRAVPGKGCDWAAFGLFSGPLFVKRESGEETPIFDFAGKPFTAREEATAAE